MKTTGNIILKSLQCNNCNEKLLNKPYDVTCLNCGTKYKIIDLTVNEDYTVSAEFKEDGFICMEMNSFELCSNSCPMSFMYCENHCDDTAVSKAEYIIKISKDRVQKAKDKLDLIKKSKKTWAIIKLSGIDNE